MFLLFGSGGIVDIGQGVELVHDDVDIVAANAVALHRDALAFISTGNGVELSTLYFTLLAVEMVGNGVDASRIAHKNDSVGQLLGLQMEVET